MPSPTSNALYGTKEYWESEGAFDWFKSYRDIAPLLRELIPCKDARILMLGCGNSMLSQDMYDDGYKNIVNTDYSSVVIEQMRARHLEMEYKNAGLEMDVRDLQFADGTFDIVIDKGTMDAMMTANGDVWDPPQQVIDDCTAEVDEVIRTLKNGVGVFVYLTFGQPHFRRRFLTRPNTTLKVTELGDAFHYYLYILRT
ncbi:S-adenosyl-L-methionine-dependent methyltransferase [Mycena epipterygia]|nr:S-adenosyl-L-methionine-dependent methyltransferase [Mycena epipterygia]